jgi:hypothetical protein
MADNLQRSLGRPEEYKFDRGGNPVEMGPFVGIVVNNIDNTRSGRLQVWIQQFGAVDTDGSPKLDDPTTWRTVRYISPFYGATQQSGVNGIGTYPGNRNSYGMWFTPPELGTKVLCVFVGGDPTIGGYYLGCIPEDGINRMIPAIGAVSNYNPNNASQKQLLNGVGAAPVTEVNDIDPKFADDPRFFDKQKPVQSTVEGILLQQGLNKDPIRGPIKSSAQRESPSNCYGISTPGKAIYQGGYSDKTLKTSLEKGQVKLQDIAVIGRQGGHTFVMDDGDIDGNDTLVRIRTAKGHQITMSDDGDAFYITHANGQTWIELGKQGTVDVYSTNSINLRTQGVLNFHADKGINMYSGGTFRIKSKKTMLVESSENLLLGSDQFTLLSAKKTLGIRSDGTLGLQGKFCSVKSDSLINLSGKLINLNGGQSISVPAMPTTTDFTLADTTFVSGKGWVIQPGALKTIVSRAPTHEPYQGHGSSADVTINLNPIKYDIPDPSGSVAKIYADVDSTAVQRGVTIATVSAEPTAVSEVGPLSVSQVTALTAQAAENQSLQYPAYDDDGNLMPGYELTENNDPIYVGPSLGSSSRGIGEYGQSIQGLVSVGLVKSSALSLINSGVSPDLVLKSNSSWLGQFGIGSITDYLNSKTIQNIVQVGLMVASYTGLVNSGVIKGNEDPRLVATLVQPATQYGVDSVVQWTDGFADTQVQSDLTIAARQGQYAIDFVEYYGEEINLVNTPPDGTNASRDVIDQAIVDIIDNPKVPVPQYTDIPAESVNTTETVIQNDGSLTKVDRQVVSIPPGAFTSVANNVPQTTTVQVDVPSTTSDDGTFRLAPSSNKG